MSLAAGAGTGAGRDLGSGVLEPRTASHNATVPSVARPPVPAALPGHYRAQVNGSPTGMKCRAAGMEGDQMNLVGSGPADGVRLPEFIAVQIPPWSARPELSRRRRVGVLAACCSAVFMVGLDNTAVNV